VGFGLAPVERRRLMIALADVAGSLVARLCGVLPCVRGTLRRLRGKFLKRSEFKRVSLHGPGILPMWEQELIRVFHGFRPDQIRP
jgi:hypothetical protein